MHFIRLLDDDAIKDNILPERLYIFPDSAAVVIELCHVSYLWLQRISYRYKLYHFFSPLAGL